MKYDLLHTVREHLNERHTPATAKTYYQALKSLLKNMQFNAAEELDTRELEKNLAACKTKRDLSAAKCGLLAFKELYPELQLPTDQFFQETSNRKRNFRKRAFEPVTLDSIKRKINVVKDKRKKTAYRLALVSGLRVSELAALEPEHVRLEDGQITLSVINGKGGKDRQVDCLPDPYTYGNMAELLKEAEPGEKLFPRAADLQAEATQKGFECHDLRRAFAKCYKAHYQGTGSAYAINGQLMAAMGHNRFRITQRYLNRKIDIGEGRKGIERSAQK